MPTSGHKSNQPGLRGHSFSEDNLLKQFLVLEQKESGRLAVKSFENLVDAFEWVLEQDEKADFLIKDQFGDKIVYDETLGQNR